MDILAVQPNVLRCGDSNTTVHPQLDALNAALPESWDWLRDQIHGGDRQLLDSYRVLHPTGRGFTRYAGGRHTSAKRIEMALASKGLGKNFPFTATMSAQEKYRTTDITQ